MPPWLIRPRPVWYRPSITKRVSETASRAVPWWPFTCPTASGLGEPRYKYSNRYVAIVCDRTSAENVLVEVLVGSEAVKDVIKALGVPHTEVDLPVVNGESQAFEYRLQDGDRVSVYPVFEAFDWCGDARPPPAAARAPLCPGTCTWASWRGC
jgi:hypothetical protein